MSKVFLLAYGRELGTRPRIKACLNSMPEIISWRSEIPSTFFLLSDTDAKTLAINLQKCLEAEKPRFIITELSSETWGWLARDSWNFLKQTQPAAKD